MTSVHSPGPVAGSPLDEASPALDGAIESISIVAFDLTYAYTLLEAIEIMHNQPDVNTLLSAVAEYGTTIISADGIAIIHKTAGRWRPMIIRETEDEPDVAGMHQVIELLAADGGLQQCRWVDDLSQHQWSGLAISSNLRAWQSLLVMPSEPRNDHLPTLMWWSRRRGAFEGQMDIAELFATANFGSLPTRSFGSVTWSPIRPRRNATASSEGTGPTIDDGGNQWHPAGAAAVVIGVSPRRHRRHRATPLGVDDAVHDLVVDAVAAHGNDQRSPGCCRSTG
jgi:hypothetical protein